MSAFPTGLEPVEDLGPSVWVQEALKGWPAGRFCVHDLVAPIFEAYARVLHRARGPEDRLSPSRRWVERAEQLGRTLGPETSWYELTSTNFADGAAADAWVPTEGGLSEDEVRSLAALLAGHTSTPDDCRFALWFGWGVLTGGAPLVAVRGRFDGWRVRRRARTRNRRERRAMGRVRTFELLGRSGRSYLLLEGSVADAERFEFGEGAWFQSPTLWWPADRAWFVHTEIDALSTYMGGSRALVDSLVGEQLLEAFEVHEDSLAAL
jgi:hypothetical protein